MARRDARAHMAAMLEGMHLCPAWKAERDLAAVDGSWWGRDLPVGHLTIKAIGEFIGRFAPGNDWLPVSLAVEGAQAWCRWGKPALSIADCATWSKVLRCASCTSDKAYVLVPDLCLSRYCPTCCRKNRGRTQARLRRILGRFKNRPRFLTLTVASSHDLAETKRRLLKAWARFRNRKWVRERMHGGFAVLEVTYDAVHGWHPHLHIAFDGFFMGWARIVDEWMSCTGCRCSRPRGNRKPVLCCRSTWRDDDARFQVCTHPGCFCDGSQAQPAGQFIKKIETDEAVRELGKYCAKELGEASPNLPMERLIEFLRLTWGRRTLTTFGTHFDPALEAEELEITLRALRDEYDGDPRCPVCGSTDLHETGRRATERSPP